MDAKTFIDIYKDISSNKYSLNKSKNFYEIYIFNEDTYKMNLLIYENKIKKSKLIAFETKNYLENIIKSYNSSIKNIKQQFLFDFKRTNIFINGILIREYFKFKKELKQFYKINCSHHVITNIGLLLQMLCNQSSYGTPYEIIFNLYSDEDNNIFVFSSGDNRRINIDYNKNSGSVIIETNLNVKNIKTDEIIKSINLKLNFTLNVKQILKSNTIDLIDILSKSFIILWN